MKRLKTCPALVPPPPVPPSRTSTAAANPEPSHRPSTIAAPNSFIQEVLAELKHVVWPAQSTVCAMSCITIGLLCFFILYILCLDLVMSVVSHAIGLAPK